MPSLFDRFDRALVINLPDRADRRREMTAALRRIGAEIGGGRVEFFPATRVAAAAGFPSVGARGCFLSHLAALKAARDAGWDTVLVLEDDARPLAALGEHGPALLDDLAGREWDVAMLGFLHFGDKSPENSAKDGPRWLPLDRPLIGAQSYVVRAAALARLIEGLEAILARAPGDPAGGPMHFDGTFFHLTRDTNLRGLVAVPPLFGQRSSRSDITANKLIDRLPLVRDAATLLRRARNRLQ